MAAAMTAIKTTVAALVCFTWRALDRCAARNGNFALVAVDRIAVLGARSAP
jgi:hypothetical protein